MNSKEQGFDTVKYLKSQSFHIRDRLNATNGSQVFMEFGGKPFDDQHAKRVLPGYDADCKAQLLSSLMLVGKVVMVVNARDILLPEHGRTLLGRVRDDSGLRYDHETVRLIKRGRDLNLDIKDVVVSVYPKNPSDQNKRAMDNFREELFQEGVSMHRHYEIDGYPNASIVKNSDEVFGQNDVVAQPNLHLIVFSPGGGSGKFGFILSEIYHALRNGQRPGFVKFETFPVLTVASDHALNLAFEAATADLKNRVISICSDPARGICTTYDKDFENYQLLKALFAKYSVGENTSVDQMDDPTAMSVNRIMDGVINESVIIEACRIEIQKRIKRYEREAANGIERQATLDRAQEINVVFEKKYGN